MSQRGVQAWDPIIDKDVPQRAFSPADDEQAVLMEMFREVRPAAALHLSSSSLYLPVFLKTTSVSTSALFCFGCAINLQNQP